MGFTLVYRLDGDESADNPEKAFIGNGNKYKDKARIAKLEKMVGQLYAEND